MNKTLKTRLEDQTISAEAPNFNRLARVYRWMEWFSFGPWLWRCRCAFLGEINSCRRALVLGDGDGRFTSRLLSENQSVLIDAVDASSAMLSEFARRAGPHAARVRLHLADAREWPPPNSDYDLIVTHFFLDCLTTNDVAQLAARLQSHLQPGTTWVVSEFAIPDSRFGRVLARPLITALYWAFGFLTGLTILRLPHYRDALAHLGFALRRERRWLGGLLVSELWTI
jgi:ubiquinone/menaquinone biosynthesis C-methylase UbiE